MKKKILVVGLGYVGVHILLKLDKKMFNVYGYDKSKKKISELRQGIDSTLQYKNLKLNNKKLFAKIPNEHKFNLVILCLPTPLKIIDPIYLSLKMHSSKLKII